MLKQISITDCVGKTIQALEHSFPDDMAIAFTDGTFVFLRAEEEADYDNVTSYLRSVEVSLNPDNFHPGSDCLEKAGVYTAEERDAAAKTVDDRQKEAWRLHRLAQFKQLRNEFAPPTPEEAAAEAAAQQEEFDRNRAEHARQLRPLIEAMYKPREKATQ